MFLYTTYYRTFRQKFCAVDAFFALKFAFILHFTAEIYSDGQSNKTGRAGVVSSTQMELTVSKLRA